MPDPTTDNVPRENGGSPADLAAASREPARSEGDSQIPTARADHRTESTRGRLAISAVLCIVIGVILYVTGQRAEISGAFMRVGLLAATTWYAFPTLSRIRWWPKNSVETAALYTMGILMVVRPRIFVPIGLALGLLLLFKIPGRPKRD